MDMLLLTAMIMHKAYYKYLVHNIIWAKPIIIFQKS